MSGLRDETIPSGKWEFDQAVTDVFDNMLERSIPDYANMRKLTTALAIRYAQPGTEIVDLGCSRGGSLAPIIEALKNSNTYKGVEVSAPMREAATARFAGNNRVEILATDLRTDYPQTRASVTLAVLTIQFTPIEYRQKIIQRIYNSTLPGGVILLVEKILGADAITDELFVETYYAEKGENGYTPEQINTKRESLEGVLVPITAEWNKNLLENAGFRHVDTYWKHLNFAAWIGVKE
jgi:tRNA (cmo5U34)-methyltransferase